jgi:23S rRNA (adenine2503-C2)-methyltransferase
MDLGKGELAKYFLSIGEKEYKANQMVKWIYKKGVLDFNSMTDLSKDLRKRLVDECQIKIPEIILQRDSSDGTRKWVINVGEGDLIEMVLIPEGKRVTLCISSQVGCAIDCSFCATGKQGFSRNLTLSEIIGQLWIAENSFSNPREQGQRNITNVVMMGMGEPLHNFDPVVKAIELMLDNNAYGLSKRRVTLSTSGLVPQIDELSKSSDVSLTISLHAPNDKLRNELMPINKKYPIKDLLKSVKRYVDKCNDSRITTFEYILIDRVNDSLELAEELANLLMDFPCKINLIPFNSFSESNYKRPSGNRVKRFQEFLQTKGYVVTVRSTRGDDIMAACGQLVGRVNDKTRRKERKEKKDLIKAKSI